MQVFLDRQGRAAGLATLLAGLARESKTAAVMVLSAAGNNLQEPAEAAALTALLRDFPKPLFGGIFPQLVYGDERLLRGTIVVALPVAAEITVIDELSNPAVDFDLALAGLAGAGEECTWLIFLDGFSRRIAALVEAMLVNLGCNHHFIGGGAGSLTLKSQPCLFNNQGFLADAALLVKLPLPGGVGVAHGWEIISDSFKVTEASFTSLQTLDWRPAFEVYREAVAAHCDCLPTPDNFFEIAKAYPFGIGKFGAEVVVRDPLMVGEGGALVCVGEIPEGSFVHILHGRPDSLVAAAGLAKQRAEASFPGQRADWLLLIDCISRVLFLADDFGRELAAIRDHRPLIGALTIGEIANSGLDCLEFYNKTVVVGAFGE